MPERRSLRSNKSDTAPSTNGDKATSTSQTSGSTKDKPRPARSTSSRSKSFSNKKGITAGAKDTSGDSPHLNGSDPTENGVDSVNDPKADSEPANSTAIKKSGNDKDGDEEMTVVVPPPKVSKLSDSAKKDDEGDIAMNGLDDSESKTQEDAAEPHAKAIDSRCFQSELLPRKTPEY